MMIALMTGALLIILPPRLDAPRCTVFLLKTVGSHPTVESVILKDGERLEFAVDASSEFITTLRPYGVGQSGEVVQRAQQPARGVVRCIQDEIHTTYHRPDGSEHALPVVSMEEIRRHDMRINVTGADGTRRAFWIKAGFSITPADGPVIDMFGGMIPLQPGDYAVTVETTRHAEHPVIEGRAGITFNGDHFFVEGSIEGARSGLFIVDFGAGTTVLDKAALPSDAVIEPLVGLEYSVAGVREVAGVASGLGGHVESFLGRASVDRLKFGSADFSDVTVSVVSSIPSIDGLAPIGILGLDLLSRGEIVSVDVPRPGDSAQATLEWQRSADPQPSAEIEIPFSVANNHLFIGGSIDSMEVDFMFDTGARVSIMPSELADRARLVKVGSDPRVLHGLDGTPIETHVRQADQIRLGGGQYIDVPFHTGEISVLNNWGLRSDGAILGNDFLRRFGRIEVDFGHEVVRLLD
jgi:predicted aspartyl protease